MSKQFYKTNIDIKTLQHDFIFLKKTNYWLTGNTFMDIIKRKINKN